MGMFQAPMRLSAGPAAVACFCFATLALNCVRGQSNPAAGKADSQPQIPRFAVTSVKLNPQARGWRLAPTMDGWSGTGVSLRNLINEAYGPLHQDKIDGWPLWANTAQFDIDGKVDDADLAAYQSLLYPQKKIMLQALLADRFKLAVHFEPQLQPVFALVVAKSGAKIKPTTADELPKDASPEYGHISRSRNGEFEAVNLTIDSFAEIIGGWTGRVVVDKTGLKGRYDFNLHWSPDADFAPGHPALAGDGTTPAASISPAGPSIFTAFEEQLGLKLVPDKAPLPAIVIDHVEQPEPN
jgi:uncharacterized protein (TIGR03435 family)